MTENCRGWRGCRLLYPPMDKFFRMILLSYGKLSGPCPCVSWPPSWRYFPVSRAERFPRNFLAMVAALGQTLRHFVWPRRSLQPAVCGYSPVRFEPQRKVPARQGQQNLFRVYSVLLKISFALSVFHCSSGFALKMVPSATIPSEYPPFQNESETSADKE